MALETTRITRAYPLDSMVERVDADGLPVYDRPYNASDLRAANALMVTDGVFKNYLECCSVGRVGDSWYVRPGGAVAAGLYVPVPSAVHVLDQSDIPSGSYAHVVLAARFDTQYRDAAVYARVNTQQDYAPVRTDSLHELVLGRIDWRGTCRDTRLEPGKCGYVCALAEGDTSAFVEELRAKVAEYELSVGLVEALSPDERPYVRIEGRSELGGETVVGFGLPQGPTGPAGPTGAAGPVGLQGPAGPAGAQGPTGRTGPEGPQGIQGPAGAAGPLGPKGEVGPAGSQGPKGETGNAGAAGPQGPKGDTGPVGPQGEVGPKGDAGAAGPPGLQGETGPAGPQGAKGATGATGPAGPQGPKGDTGPVGPRGEQGPRGPAGEIGPAGESGVYTQISGLFGISVDPSGDLCVTYADGGTSPPVSLDEDFNLIYEIPEA